MPKTASTQIAVIGIGSERDEAEPRQRPIERLTQHVNGVRPLR